MKYAVNNNSAIHCQHFDYHDHDDDNDVCVNDDHHDVNDLDYVLWPNKNKVWFYEEILQEVEDEKDLLVGHSKSVINAKVSSLLLPKTHPMDVNERTMAVVYCMYIADATVVVFVVVCIFLVCRCLLRDFLFYFLIRQDGVRADKKVRRFEGFGI